MSINRQFLDVIPLDPLSLVINFLSLVNFRQINLLEYQKGYFGLPYNQQI